MKSILLFGCFLVLNFVAFSQSSKVTGTVQSEGSNLPIEGIQVEIKGLNLTVTTDINGLYTFENITPGTYKLHFSEITIN